MIIFLNVLTAFRVAEFNAYLEIFPSTQVYSTSSVGSIPFKQALKEYASCYPQFKKQVAKFHPLRQLHGSLIYIVFLHNAYNFISVIERDSIPFIFELYPGGTFQLEDPASDAKLRRVCSSPLFRKVIVTQKVTYDYLLAKQFCSVTQIEYVFGVALLSEQLNSQRVVKKRYPQDKATFDICFVANKYTERGTDKGYDIFVEAAKKLCFLSGATCFHVVGTFSEADIDISDLKGRIKFYGSQNTDFFPEFYSRMDIILSPNLPFVLAQGAFDGFPTGACVEAGLCGVAVFCTDVLNLNTTFVPDRDIKFVSHNAISIFEDIRFYLHNVELLYNLSEAGRIKFAELFNADAQLKPRVRILQQYLS